MKEKIFTFAKKISAKISQKNIISAGIAGLAMAITIIFATTSQANTTFTIPVDTHGRAEPGTERQLSEHSIPNGQYSVKLTSYNNHSVREGTDMLVRSGSSTVEVKNFESSAFREGIIHGVLAVTGNKITLNVRVGATGSYSGGVVVELTKVIPSITVCEKTTRKMVTIKEDAFDANKHAKITAEECNPTIQVCEIATKKIITIKTSQFEANPANYSKDTKNCDPTMDVCEIATKKIITIKSSEFDKSKHNKDTTNCDPSLEVCEIETKEVITIKQSEFDASKHKDANDTHCSPDPVVTELPKTGISSTLLSAIGLGALVTGASYYFTSRRSTGTQ